MRTKSQHLALAAALIAFDPTLSALYSVPDEIGRDRSPRTWITPSIKLAGSVLAIFAACSINWHAVISASSESDLILTGMLVVAVAIHREIRRVSIKNRTFPLEFA